MAPALLIKSRSRQGNNHKPENTGFHVNRATFFGQFLTNILSSILSTDLSGKWKPQTAVEWSMGQHIDLGLTDEHVCRLAAKHNLDNNGS